MQMVFARLVPVLLTVLDLLMAVSSLDKQSAIPPLVSVLVLVLRTTTVPMVSLTVTRMASAGLVTLMDILVAPPTMDLLLQVPTPFVGLMEPALTRMTAPNTVVTKEVVLPIKIVKNLEPVFPVTALLLGLDVAPLMVVLPRTNLLVTLLPSCVLPAMATLDLVPPLLAAPLPPTVTRMEVAFLAPLILLVVSVMEDALLTNPTVIHKPTFVSTIVPQIYNAEQWILATLIAPLIGDVV